ncbi:MAG: 16S rRNA (cytidine(1402)-2'-O)-methyltransferase [Pseudomonadota bacterium]
MTNEPGHKLDRPGHSARKGDVSSQSIEAALSRLLGQATSQSLNAGLYLVATPIGNLADITVRAVAIIARADRVFCEDTRVTRRLLDACGVLRTLETYHEHNASEVRPRILAALADKQVVALVSDAGTPLISDPGYKLVAEAAAAGHLVSAVPGASALTAALSVAGLPTDSVTFLGFLPAKSGARAARLEPFATVHTTLVVYEAPHRLAATLGGLHHVLGSRDAVVARELTKLHEDVRRGALDALAQWAEGATIKGEVAIVIGPPHGPVVVSDDEIAAYLGTLMAEHRLAEAARLAADHFKVPRQRAYQLGLKLKGQTHG